MGAMSELTVAHSSRPGRPDPHRRHRGRRRATWRARRVGGHDGPVSAGVVLGLAVALLVASSVQAITGFGFALLSMPLLTLVIDAKEAVAVSTLVGALASASLLARTYRSVRWDLTRWLLAGAVAGMPIGLVVLLVIDARALKVAIAVAVLAFVVVLGRGWRLEGTGPRAEVAAGFVSGVLNTSVSTNGPPLVLALQARGLDPEEFRGTISAVFAASSLVANTLFTASGRYDAHVLGYAAIGPPALLVGGMVGRRLGRRLAPDRFRPLVFTLLVVAACSAALSAMLG